MIVKFHSSRVYADPKEMWSQMWSHTSLYIVFAIQYFAVAQVLGWLPWKETRSFPWVQYHPSQRERAKIVSNMGQCFVFLLEMVLIAQTCFCCCWAVFTEPRPFPLPTPPHQGGGWGSTRIWEGTQMGQLSPTDQKDIPDHKASCTVYKVGERRMEERKFGVIVFVFPGHCYMWWGPAFLEMAEHLPAHGKQWTHSLAFYPCVCGFCLPYLSVFISTHMFS